MKKLDTKHPLFKVIFITVIIIIIANLTFSFEPGVSSAREKQNEFAKKYITELKQNSERILKSSDTDINRLKSEIESELKKVQESFEEFEILSKTKIYLWTSDSNNNYLKGTPEKDLAFLNQVYKKNKTMIKNDMVFKNKNEFFINFLTHQENFDFDNTNLKIENSWRFSNEKIWDKENRGVFYIRLKKAGQNKDLHLIIDDSRNRWSVYANTALELKKDQVRYNRLINILGFLIIWLMIPSWIYQDAVKRKIEYPLIWAMLSLFSFIFGLLIYIYFRPKSEVNCSSCNHSNHVNSEYCVNCGIELLKRDRCNSCDKAISSTWKFCSHCGEDLSIS